MSEYLDDEAEASAGPIRLRVGETWGSIWMHGGVDAGVSDKSVISVVADGSEFVVTALGAGRAMVLLKTVPGSKTHELVDNPPDYKAVGNLEIVVVGEEVGA